MYKHEIKIGERYRVDFPGGWWGRAKVKDIIRRSPRAKRTILVVDIFGDEHLVTAAKMSPWDEETQRAWVERAFVELWERVDKLEDDALEEELPESGAAA